MGVVARYEFTELKKDVDAHIAEDEVKWEKFDRLEKSVVALQSRVTQCTAIIVCVMFLWSNGLLNFDKLFSSMNKAKGGVSDTQY